MYVWNINPWNQTCTYIGEDSKQFPGAIEKPERIKANVITAIISIRKGLKATIKTDTATIKILPPSRKYPSLFEFQQIVGQIIEDINT